MTITDTTTISRLAPVRPVADWPVPRELTADLAQQSFRAMMEAYSRPGSLHQLPSDAVPECVPAVLIPLLTLADLMTPIAALPTRGEPLDASPVQEALALAGRLLVASLAEPETTRFAVAFGEPDPTAFRRLNTGSHWSPETGAMLFQRVGSLDATPDGDWVLSGPGVKPDEPTGLTVGGLGAEFLAVRAELVADYPAGIDVLLVTDEGRIAALSRNTRVEPKAEVA